MRHKTPDGKFSEARYLLGLEEMGYKMLLQFLIGVVDAQLLQVIFGKRFKPINIQQACNEEARH